MCEGLTRDFTENYMEKVFYFCLKKTGDNTEAEDLTQDIALQIITALNKVTVPTSFSAWVWQIARNRYCVWATEKHKRNESLTGCDIGDYEIQDESSSFLEEMVYAEQMALLRRELAFIKKDYRSIIVAYYIENKSVRDIAVSTSLSESAVQQRLHRARNILKEGMNMAIEFGKRSYKTEEVSFVMNGRDGKKGQPWSIITHLLYKNIFLETYENPETAEQLALELGVAMPYMEDELEFLVREQLLRKEGNKYTTDFCIISRDEQRKNFDANERVKKPLTDKICELVDTYITEIGEKVNFSHIGYDSAKWALIVRTFDWLKWSARDRIYSREEYRNSYPSRPDEGAWVIVGYESVDYEEPCFVGQHGYISYDKNEVTEDINFGQFKFYYNNIQEKTPEHLTWKEAYTLWLVCNDRIGECEDGYVDKLKEYGYLNCVADKLVPNVVIFYRSEEDVTNEKLKAIHYDIDELLKQAPNIDRGYVVEQAIKDGWLKQDENTANTIGAFIYI